MPVKTSRSVIIHQRKNIPSNFFPKKQFRNPYFIITYIFLLLFVCLKLLTIPLPFPPQSPKTAIFQAQGIGNVTSIPNSTTLSFSITKTAATVADAQNQVHSSGNTIIQTIKAASTSAENIKTVNYTVFPQYSVDITGKQIPSGYTVTQTIQATVSPIDKTGTIINLATTNGADQIGGISFITDNKTQKELQQQARIKAIQNAKEKAMTLAKAAGIHLGKIIDIKENQTTNNQPVPFTATSVNSIQADGLTQQPTGENTITSTVTLSYETE